MNSAVYRKSSEWYVEVWSYAMRICEPCQVGNKAALSGISHVPQGRRMEYRFVLPVCGLCEWRG